MNTIKSDNKEIQKENQNELRTLEEFYVTSKVEDLTLVLDEKKKSITNEIVNYAKNHKAPYFDRNGNKISEFVRMNPMVVSNYFFKSINPLPNKIPQYNAEKLGLVFEYYMYILGEVNDKIGNFPSSLTSFCKLAGISLNTLREYRNSADLDMRNVVEKIYDQISDENITMGQLGVVKEKTTVFKLKAQNEVVEKQQPNINISYKETINRDEINDRIDKYKSFIERKATIVGDNNGK